MNEPPLLQVGHATGHLHSVLTQSVDQHWTLWTDTSQTLQQRTQRSQFSHLYNMEGGGDRERVTERCVCW